jgi:hypothetical protein
MDKPFILIFIQIVKNVGGTPKADMFDYFRTVLNPDSYHGQGKQGPFFEGWYFKIITAGEESRWCIIPGVYIGKDPAYSHAFVQILNGVNGQSIYQTFDYRQFHAAAPGKFEVSIVDNVFTANSLKLAITNPELQVNGELQFEQVTPWPVSILSPGIMGWYGWVPFMECYHGVVSLDHRIQGWLEVNGTRTDFTGGRGYTEKDWGQSFPKAWVWMQTNHFSRPGTSLTASAANIPWRKTEFNGFIAGLWTDHHLHRFATYTGARLDECIVTDTEARMVVSDRSKRLELLAVRAEGGMLRAPTATQMDRRISETLSAQVRVKLFKRKGDHWTVEFDDTGRYAGLEVSGKLKR